MKKLILALALLFAPTLAFGQCNGVYTAGQVCGSVAGGIPGPVTLPALGDRIRLTVNTTFYVDNVLGSNSNDCLAPGAGHACLTSGFTFNKILNQYDVSGKTVTVQFASGQTWNNVNITSNAIVTLLVGTAANFVIDGGGGTFTSSTTAAAVFIAMTRSSNVVIQNVTIGNTGGGDGLQCASGGFSIFSGVTFASASGGTQIHVAGDCIGSAPFNYSISGGAANHIFAESGAGEMNLSNTTITLSGTPAYSGAFAYAWTNGSVFANGTTFSGSATGVRYLVTTNGSINTNGGGANFFPGNSPGQTLTGGVYDTPGTPGISSCGTSPGAATGNDYSGHVTEGTTATGCTITFTTGSTFVGCTANLSTAAAVGINTLGSTLVVVHGSLSSNVLYWNCKTQ